MSNSNRSCQKHPREIGQGRLSAQAMTGPMYEFSPMVASLATNRNPMGNQMHHSSYAAFCRKYGVHGAKGKQRNWNADLVSPVYKTLYQPWSAMDELLDSEMTGLITSIDDIFKSLCDVLEGILFSVHHIYLRLACMISKVVVDAERSYLAPEAIDNLLRTMERRGAAMVDSIKSSTVRFIQRITYNLPYKHIIPGTRTERTNLYTVDFNETWSTATTAPTWHTSCAQLILPVTANTVSHSPNQQIQTCAGVLTIITDPGRGSDFRRKSHMAYHLEYSGMFTDFYMFAREDYQVLVDEVSDEIHERAGKHMKAISRDMRAVVVEEGEISEAERFRSLAGRTREDVLGVQDVLCVARRVVAELGDSPAGH